MVNLMEAFLTKQSGQNLEHWKEGKMRKQRQRVSTRLLAERVLAGRGGRVNGEFCI